MPSPPSSERSERSDAVGKPVRTVDSGFEREATLDRVVVGEIDVEPVLGFLHEVLGRLARIRGRAWNGGEHRVLQGGLFARRPFERRQLRFNGLANLQPPLAR